MYFACYACTERLQLSSWSRQNACFACCASSKGAAEVKDTIARDAVGQYRSKQQLAQKLLIKKSKRFSCNRLYAGVLLLRECC